MRELLANEALMKMMRIALDEKGAQRKLVLANFGFSGESSSLVGLRVALVMYGTLLSLKVMEKR